MERIMALDVGDARIGVALSDPLGLTAQPHSSVEHNGRSIRSIISIVEEHGVQEIVVGLPLELSGERGPQARKVEALVTGLRSALDRRGMKAVRIVFFDERFTTAEAKRVTAGSGLKDAESRAALDRVSAALILEGYLERLSLAVRDSHAARGNGAEGMHPERPVESRS